MTEVNERVKEQIREEWLVKEEFSCKKCGASGDDIGYNEPDGAIFCKKCSHTLTEKNELEDLVYFVEFCQYGFFMRIFHDHFIPCDECQEKFEKILVGKIKDWYIYDLPLKVELDYFGPQWRFKFPWIGTTKSVNDVNVVLLCKKCGKVLEDGMVNADKWTIGNKDYEPAIELWRKWKVDDKRTQQLEKLMERARKVGIHKNSFLANVRNKATTKEFDEFIRTTTIQVDLMEEHKKQEKARKRRG